MNFWWKFGVVALAIVAVFLFGDHYGAQGVQAKWDAAKLASAGETIKAESNVITKERAAVTITTGVSNDYEKKLFSLNSAYDGYGLQLDNTAAGNYSASFPDAAGRHNGAACTNGFSGRSKKTIASLMKAADIQTARLQACQAWIRAQASQ